MQGFPHRGDYTVGFQPSFQSLCKTLGPKLALCNQKSCVASPVHPALKSFWFNCRQVKVKGTQLTASPLVWKRTDVSFLKVRSYYNTLNSNKSMLFLRRITHWEHFSYFDWYDNQTGIKLKMKNVFKSFKFNLKLNLNSTTAETCLVAIVFSWRTVE